MKNIPLSNGMTACVDDEDFERVTLLTWNSSNRKTVTYATAYLKGSGRKNTKRVYLHRYILNAAKGTEVDHLNHNGLDCRRANLRVCSTSENRRNQRPIRGGQSGFKGVGTKPNCKARPWRAYLNIGKKQKSLGMYSSAHEAALAYDAAALAHFGAFASLNFKKRSFKPIVIPCYGAVIHKNQIAWVSAEDARKFYDHLGKILK